MLIVPRFAHEVYVLTPNQINHDEHIQSPNVFHALNNAHNLRLFIILSLLALCILGFALFLKSTKPFTRLGKLIDKTTVAPDVIRIAFGASLIISAKNSAFLARNYP